MTKLADIDRAREFARLIKENAGPFGVVGASADDWSDYNSFSLFAHLAVRGVYTDFIPKDRATFSLRKIGTEIKRAARKLGGITLESIEMPKSKSDEFHRRGLQSYDGTAIHIIARVEV